MSLNPLKILGGAEGDRTPDLLTASQARSQLRYSPKCEWKCYHCVWQVSSLKYCYWANLRLKRIPHPHLRLHL